MAHRHLALPLLLAPFLMGYYVPIPEWTDERPVLDVALDQSLPSDQRADAIRHMGELSCDDPVADLLTVWDVASDEATLALECGRMLARFDDRRVIPLLASWQASGDEILGRLAGSYRDEVRTIHESLQVPHLRESMDGAGVVTYEIKMALRPWCGNLINEVGCHPTTPDDIRPLTQQAD